MQSEQAILLVPENSITILKGNDYDCSSKLSTSKELSDIRRLTRSSAQLQNQDNDFCTLEKESLNSNIIMNLPELPENLSDCKESINDFSRSYDLQRN
mmetsp:Transcript_14224/g.15901  ORF Transcript_14224/g.15901 Transcript_14224/m.15901 type:complete len:98 (+) Transcript_14224:65-358(+)